MARRAVEGEMECLLAPALLDVCVRQRLLEDAQHVLEEVTQLLAAADAMYLGCDLFQTPQRAASPGQEP